MRMIVIGLAAALAACSMSGDNDDRGPGVAPSGGGTSRSFAVADFTSVELAGSDNVDVRVGPAFSVRAEGPVAVLDKLRIDKRGDTLEVGRKKGMSWGSHDHAKIYVTMPRITGATLAGSGDMAIDRAEGAAFAATVAGSGDLAVAALAVDTAKLSVAGSGNMTARGRAKTLAIDIAGSGDVDAGGLTAGQGSVSIAGSGDVHAAIDGPAKVSIVGSGDVDLGPRARCSVSKMGSGTVTCG